MSRVGRNEGKFGNLFIKLLALMFKTQMLCELCWSRRVLVEEALGVVWTVCLTMALVASSQPYCMLSMSMWS